MLRSVQASLESLHRDLGWKQLNPWWAKLEILAGLAVAGVGIAILSQPLAIAELPIKVAGLAVFVLGAYLAMAGHRSHLYQSNNLLASWLVQALKEQNETKDNS
jgi:hypothetical protein